MIITVVIWVRMAPVVSCVWKLGPQLVDQFGKEWEVCGLVGGGVSVIGVGLEISKAHTIPS